MKIRRFSDWGLFSKVMSLFLFMAVVVLLGMMFYFLPLFESSLMQEKKASNQFLVEEAWSVIDHYGKLAESGAMSEAKAKEEALNNIRDMRYDVDNYFWITDVDVKMVMHPLKPELDGTDVSGSADPNGKLLFVEMSKVAKGEGQGFVDYMWPKPGFIEPVGKISYVKLYKPWGWIVGSGMYVDDIAAQAAELKFKILVPVVVVTLFVIALVFFVIRSVVAQLKGGLELADAISTGDLTKRMNVARKDEVGQLSNALDKMADGLESKAELAGRIAEGDLTPDVVLASEKDSLGKALKLMTDNLNDVIHQVAEAAAQVDSGSEQVSQSSQALSQGATETAASLEEITSSATEIGSQTKENASNAAEANKLAAESRKAADKGAEEMNSMMSAMTEISDSSQAIAKIIKVIDEIAFQTNLLALNAAVEAARAGRHGKGFAVVAEEVRNLASRSAKAAQETAQLIEGSLDKVKNGNEIAETTSQALSGIVDMIAKVDVLVEGISAASDQQAEGIGQISQGLDQIDQVTQQNTANSEETASAAEELSSQAAELNNILTRFKLRDQAGGMRMSVQRVKPKPLPQAMHRPAPRPAADPAQGEWADDSSSSVDPGDVISLDDNEFGKF